MVTVAFERPVTIPTKSQSGALDCRSCLVVLPRGRVHETGPSHTARRSFPVCAKERGKTNQVMRGWVGCSAAKSILSQLFRGDRAQHF